MKARIRSTVTAMALLAPLAATFVAQPVAAQQRAAPAITSMALNADAGLAPGSTLRFQLTASPNLPQARVALGDSGVTVDLEQKGPGKYSGSYVVRRADRIDPSQLMTVRVSDGSHAWSRSFSYPPAFQALAASGDDRGERRAERREERREERQERREERREARNDRSAPQITEIAPAHGDRIGERGRAHITARLSDVGAGIDPSSVRLSLGGRDVTSDTRVTAEGIDYRSDLEPGRYTAELTVRDHADNMTRKQWTFDVLERNRDRVGSGPLPLQVTSHNDNAVVDAGGRVVLQGRTAPHATVRVQVDSILSAGGFGVAQPMMDQTVQADRNGHFNVPIAAGGLVLPGTRYDVRLTSTAGNQTAQERLTLHRQG